MALLVPAGGIYKAHAGNMTLTIHTFGPDLLATHEVIMHNEPFVPYAPPPC